jgi:hypothetical protein
MSTPTPYLIELSYRQVWFRTYPPGTLYVTFALDHGRALRTTRPSIIMSTSLADVSCPHSPLNLTSPPMQLLEVLPPGQSKDGRIRCTIC